MCTRRDAAVIPPIGGTVAPQCGAHSWNARTKGLFGPDATQMTELSNTNTHNLLQSAPGERYWRVVEVGVGGGCL